MSRKIFLTERELYNLIKESVSAILYEANNNLPLDDFLHDMKDIGFIVKCSKGGDAIKHYLDYNGKQAVQICHAPSNGSNSMKGATLNDVKKELERIGWFDDPENVKKFPFDRWQLRPPYVQEDTTQEEIDAANEKYKDATVYPIFPTKDSICALEVSRDQINLCKDSDDRRPLSDIWFNYIVYGDQVNYMVRDNYETMETEYYPVSPDGEIDDENVVIKESKRY